jgi:ABC-type multidrug transport system fused ATPase/permease subunit
MPQPASATHVGIFDLYRNIWRHAEGVRHRLIASTGLLISSQIVKLLVPYLAAQAINHLQAGTHGFAGAALWIPAIIGVYTLTWLMHGPGRVLERSVGVRVRQSLSDALYVHLSHAPLAWHDRHHSGDVQHRVGQATRALSDFAQNQFIYLQNTVNLFGPLIALTLLSTLAGGMALAGFIGIATVIVAFDRALMRVAAQENTAERRYAASVLDCLANISTIMSLRLQASTRRLLGKRLEAVFAPMKRSITLNEWKWCAVDMMTITLTWSLVCAYAWHMQSKTALLLGNLFMVYQYAGQAGGVIGSIAANFQSFARVRTDFASADPIWEAPQSRGMASGEGQNGAMGADEWQRLDIRDISYAHGHILSDADGQRGGLHKVSLRLHRGERVALVGPSGSGKSTLLRVLAGLYEPAHGHIEVDGAALIGQRTLAPYATLIPQEAEVFEATVRENIAFDLPHKDAAIEQAMHISAFHTVLAGMPQKLDTPITEGGFNLSGGQRQRLCLARGVLAARDSSVLLLDEPTSALDPLTEAQVHRRLDQAFPDACIVASVHRMSLLSHFDTVVLMALGEVLDSGTVDELLARQPLFRDMVGRHDDVDGRASKQAVPANAELRVALA